MTSPFPYLHGFSDKEQKRLVHQARFEEHSIYRDINLQAARNIIEVGCGVGAQTEILLRRFPDIHITGIDLSDAQLGAAGKYLAEFPYTKDRYKIQKMDAHAMEFESAKFDGAFLCWILEHVPEPMKVLSEVRRVVRPGCPIYITEVMNFSFFLDPYSPNVWKYWMAYNDYQYDLKGDPFVGAKLGNFLMGLGYKDIETQVITWNLDNRMPARRKEVLDYWTNLLLSGSDQLVQAKYVDQELVDNAKQELKQVSSNPNAVFFYSFMRAKATV